MTITLGLEKSRGRIRRGRIESRLALSSVGAMARVAALFLGLVHRQKSASVGSTIK
jgi:hypothetical protein